MSILRCGCSDALQKNAENGIISVNFFSLMMTLVSAVYTVVFIVFGYETMAIAAPFMTIFYPWSILLNRLKYYNYAKIWTVFILNIGVCIFSILGGESTSIHLGFYIALLLCFVFFSEWRYATYLALLPIFSWILIHYLHSRFPSDLKIDVLPNWLMKSVIGVTVMSMIAVVLIFIRHRIALLETELRAMIHRRESLLALVSHDIRNPLSITMSNLQMVCDGRFQAQPEVEKRKLLQAREGLKRIDAMLRNVQSLLAIQLGKLAIKPERHSLGNLMDQLQQLYAEKIAQKNLRLEIVSELREDIKLECDGNLILLSVFGNILSNAIKFSPRGSEIIIKIRPQAENVLISIQDRGIGIAAELAAIIFESDKPTNRRGTEGETGTGFGLPLAAEIIQIHRGSIQVESPLYEGENSGTAFHIALPRVI